MAQLSKAALKRKLKEKAGLDYERHIFLCTGPNCQPEIGAKTARFLNKRLRELGARERCHITQVGCFNLCRNGPIALIYPEGTYYCGVTPEKCARIIEEHLLNGVPVEDYAFASVPLVPKGDEAVEKATAKGKGHNAKATSNEPRSRVKSGESGKEAIHKPEELHKK